MASLGDRGVVLMLGRREARTLIPWVVPEGVNAFLKPTAWTVIGSVYDVSGDPSTLGGYLKRHIKGRLLAGSP